MKKTTQLKIRTTLMTILMTMTLNACATDTTKPTDDPNMNSRYLPFSIVFDKRGNLVVLDLNGKPLEFTETSFPIKATEIQKVESFSYVQYRGSHVGLIVRGGQMIKIKLPH